MSLAPPVPFELEATYQQLGLAADIALSCGAPPAVVDELLVAMRLAERGAHGVSRGSVVHLALEQAMNGFVRWVLEPDATAGVVPADRPRRRW